MFEELYSEINGLVRRYVDQNFKSVKAKQLGLDDRCYGLYANEGERIIAVTASANKSLLYYGGFEYVSEGVYQLGDWVFYIDASRRVEECFERLGSTED